ncbi:hypothetical protein [Bradyrhizobium retamae]|uniref:hypothetical protein n=1 Tax=Bradyrhizobium retamae TaxID=1300035 RepID=UPI0012E3D29C|nr:hypothetical protein [Bradyrhizobium retamae]
MNELPAASPGRCPERAVEVAFGELCEIGKFGNPYRRAQTRVDEVGDAPQPLCRQVQSTYPSLSRHRSGVQGTE